MNLHKLFSIEGKVALVTGGSRGIGEMIAAGFLTNGAKVYISARTAEACVATADRLSRNFAADCIGIPADVSTLDGIDALVAEIAAREEKLDILVNNAGAFSSRELDEFSEDDWDTVMDTNTKAVFFLTQKLLPLLRKSATHEDPARVINIGSVDGLKNPNWENYSYGASKAAVHHMTRQMSAHLVKQNIILNAIAPGPFPTEMLTDAVVQKRGTDAQQIDWSKLGGHNPRGRVGTAEDIAGLAIYLCSRAGAFTVGATITCDGGAVARS